MNAFIELPSLITKPITLGPVELPFSVLRLLLEFFFPLVLLVALLWFGVKLVRRSVQKVAITEDTRDRVMLWTRRVARLVWAVAIVLLASRLLRAEMARWMLLAFRALNQPFFTSGGTSVSVVTLLLVIPVFYVAGWVSRLARHSVEQGFRRHLNIDPARAFSLLSVIRFSVMVITVVIGLSVIGINLSSLAVLFGVLGIGVGFGLQDVVANSFAGLIIVLTHPIKEGDRILVGNIEGTVQ